MNEIGGGVFKIKIQLFITVRTKVMLLSLTGLRQQRIKRDTRE